MYTVGRVSLSSSKYNTVVLVSLLSGVFSLPNSELLEVRNSVLFIFISLVHNTVLGTKTVVFSQCMCCFFIIKQC